MIIEGVLEVKGRRIQSWSTLINFDQTYGRPLVFEVNCIFPSWTSKSGDQHVKRVRLVGNLVLGASRDLLEASEGLFRRSQKNSMTKRWNWKRNIVKHSGQKQLTMKKIIEEKWGKLRGKKKGQGRRRRRMKRRKGRKKEEWRASEFEELKLQVDSQFVAFRGFLSLINFDQNWSKLVKVIMQTRYSFMQR